MKLSIRIVAIVALLASLPLSAQAQQNRNDYCVAGANAMLRQHVDTAAALKGQISMQCLCNIDPDALKGYMNWCLSRATDQDLQALGTQIQHSPCTDPNSAAMQHCIQQ